jgi:hypothetical protein
LYGRGLRLVSQKVQKYDWQQTHHLIDPQATFTFLYSPFCPASLWSPWHEEGTKVASLFIL